jgi:hypothetical protein
VLVSPEKPRYPRFASPYHATPHHRHPHTISLKSHLIVAQSIPSSRPSVRNFYSSCQGSLCSWLT